MDRVTASEPSGGDGSEAVTYPWRLAAEVPWDDQEIGSTGTRDNGPQTFAARNGTEVPWRNLGHTLASMEAPRTGAAIDLFPALPHMPLILGRTGFSMRRPDTWPFSYLSGSSGSRLFSTPARRARPDLSAARDDGCVTARLIRRIAPENGPTIVWPGWDEGLADPGERSVACRIFARAS